MIVEVDSLADFCEIACSSEIGGIEIGSIPEHFLELLYWHLSLMLTLLSLLARVRLLGLRATQ